MRALAFSIRSFEQEHLLKANISGHEISFTPEQLNAETVSLAKGKEAVLIFTSDDASAPVINSLAELGIRYILTRSTGTDHIDMEAAAQREIDVANIPSYSPQAIAEQAVMLALALSRQLAPTTKMVAEFDFRIEDHIGFNFFGKTVGLVGMGNIGKAAAAIFKGLGCHVLAFDIDDQNVTEGTEKVSFEALLEKSDVISLHAPLNESSHHLINKESIAKMKKGVMLINTSRGGLLNTEDALEALNEGTIGYLGLDVYEFEKGLFFNDHRLDVKKDPLMEKLIAHKNVLITPHQGFLTREALTEIAQKAIISLDNWEETKNEKNQAR